MQNSRLIFDNIYRTFKCKVWLLIGTIFLLGSCRTLDCGCPMALESESRKNKEPRKTLERFSGVNYYSDYDSYLVR